MMPKHHGMWSKDCSSDADTDARGLVASLSAQATHLMSIILSNLQTAVRTVKATYRSFVAGCATRPKALIVISPDLRRNAHIEVLLDGRSVVDLDLEGGDDSMGR